MGAAERDFHTFNLCFCSNSASDVVALTAAQILNPEERGYPPQLAGTSPPQRSPIYGRAKQCAPTSQLGACQVMFAHDDIPCQQVMGSTNAESRALRVKG